MVQIAMVGWQIVRIQPIIIECHYQSTFPVPELIELVLSSAPYPASNFSPFPSQLKGHSSGSCVIRAIKMYEEGKPVTRSSSFSFLQIDYFVLELQMALDSN